MYAHEYDQGSSHIDANQNTTVQAQAGVENPYEHLDPQTGELLQQMVQAIV